MTSEAGSMVNGSSAGADDGLAASGVVDACCAQTSELVKAAVMSMNNDKAIFLYTI